MGLCAGAFRHRLWFCFWLGALSPGLPARQRHILATIRDHRQRIAASELGTVHPIDAGTDAGRAFMVVARAKPAIPHYALTAWGETDGIRCSIRGVTLFFFISSSHMR